MIKLSPAETWMLITGIILISFIVSFIACEIEVKNMRKKGRRE